MENILLGLEMLARWDVILALFIGSIGGVIIGAIPGVGPAVHCDLAACNLLS